MLSACALLGCTAREDEQLVMPTRADAARIALREEALLAASLLAATAGPAATVTVVVERTQYVAVTAPLARVATTAAKPAPTLASNVLAIVGDDVVTVEDFQRAFPGPALDKLPEYLRRQVRTFVEQVINNRVLAHAAMQQDYADNPHYLRDLDDAVAQVKMRYLYEATIAARSRVGEDAIKEYYAQHVKEFSLPERIRARHILVEVHANALPAERSNAWQKIQVLRRRVMEGEDFAQVAAQESGCPSRAKGGDLDFFARGQMAPAFETAAFTLERNEISGIVETEFGLHLIQLTDRIPARQRSLPEAHDDIRNQLEQTRARDLYEELLASLTNKYKVIRNERVIQELVHSRL
jgi:parvulin-like peptidyl-prolyl isomerase